MRPWSDEERRSIAAEPHRRRERAAGRLPSSGSSQDRVYTQPNRDYPDDTDLCFARGNSETRVRLTPGDRAKLLAAAGGLAPKLPDLRERAGALARHNVPALDLAARTAHVAAAQALVDEAHAAGYRLCSDDVRVAHEDAGLVSDFLLGFCEDGASPGEPWSAEDQAAISRVRRLLEP